MKFIKSVFFLSVLVGILFVTSLGSSIAAASGGSWAVEVIDEVGDEVGTSSIAMDANGNIHIAYINSTEGLILKYAFFDGTSWTIETIHSAPNTGHWATIVLDTLGQPHVVWRYSGGHKSVMYGYRDSSGWHIETVHQNSWPKHPQIALDSANRPHLTYWTDGGDKLTYAWHNGTSWTIEVVKATSHDLVNAAITIDAMDRPHIAYAFDGDDTLNYARFDNGWIFETLHTYGAATFVGPVAIELDAQGDPHIVYIDRATQDLDYFEKASGVWQRETVSTAYFGKIAFVLSSQDTPHISVSTTNDADSVINYVTKDNGTWQVETVSTGYTHGVTLDADEKPVLSIGLLARTDIDGTPGGIWLAQMNSSPTADAGGPYSGDEGSSIQLLGSANDPDGDPLTVNWTLDSPLCSFDDPTILSPTLTCGDNGSYTATLTVDDGVNDPVSSTVSITVYNVAPDVDAGPDQTVYRNDSVTVSGNWVDPAGALDEPYSWSWDLNGDGVADVSGTATYGEIIEQTTTFIVDGVATLTFTVTDKDGATTSDMVLIEVINRVPTADSQTLEMDEDTALNIDLTASDLDGDSLSYDVLVQPTSGTLTGTAPNLIYTPNANFNGNDSFTFKVNDGLIDSVEATVDIMVKPINDAPVAGDDSATTDEDVAVIIDIAANDSDVDSNLDLTSITITAYPSYGEITNIPGDGTLTYQPDPNFDGTDTFAYQICDSGVPVQCDSADVTVVLNAINDAPVAGADNAVADEDTMLVINVFGNDSDVDGNLDPGSTTLIDAPTSGTIINNGDGTFDYTPIANYHGLDSFSYQICDSGQPVLCDTALVSITINSVNDDPSCVSASPGVSSLWPPNHQFELVDIEGITDIEGDAISITVDSIFQDEPVDSNGDGSFTPDGQGIGTATAEVRAERVGGSNGRYYHINFTASDGNGGFCSGVVQVSVPKNMGKNGAAVDDGPLFDASIP